MSDFYYKVFVPAARIVAGESRCEGRAWFQREYGTHELHPAIYELLRERRIRPFDWQQLLLEWPHRSVSDFNRVAYTRDERAGMADRQTVTTLGKYLTRHFPDLHDHEVRDIVARHTTAGDMEIRYTISEIVQAALEGPRSCMSDDISVRCDDGVMRHPYEVYDPVLGWGVAVRVGSEGRIDGRALVWRSPDEPDVRGFVRTYKRGDSYSYADEALCAWLKLEGYEHWGHWPVEADMRYYAVKNSFLAPYIDGDTHSVSVSSSRGVFYVDEDGEFEADSTCGTCGERGVQCEDCGEYFDEDDMSWVGSYEDRHVCRHCLDDYVYVYGRRGNQYYVHQDDAVYVESQEEYYHSDYLSDNNIVELLNGDLEHTDNAVEIDGDWYHNEDDDICYDEYNECYQLFKNCTNTEDMGLVHDDDTWQCAASDRYYTDNVEHVEVDGATYHPDHVPETANNIGE